MSRVLINFLSVDQFVSSLPVRMRVIPLLWLTVMNSAIDMFVCLFSWRYNPLWLYFHSPVADFSLLVFEVSYHTQRRATVGRISLDEWSIRRRDLYLTTQNTRIHNLSRRAAEDLRLRPRGHWDRPAIVMPDSNCS